MLKFLSNPALKTAHKEEESATKAVPAPKLSLDKVRKKSMKESAPDLMSKKTTEIMKDSESLIACSKVDSVKSDTSRNEEEEISEADNSRTTTTTPAATSETPSPLPAPPVATGGRRKKQRCSKAGFASSSITIAATTTTTTPTTTINNTMKNSTVCGEKKTVKDVETKEANSSPSPKGSSGVEVISIEDGEGSPLQKSSAEGDSKERESEHSSNPQRKSRSTTQTPATDSLSLLLNGSKKLSMKEKEEKATKKESAQAKKGKGKPNKGGSVDASKEVVDTSQKRAGTKGKKSSSSSAATLPLVEPSSKHSGKRSKKGGVKSSDENEVQVIETTTKEKGNSETKSVSAKGKKSKDKAQDSNNEVDEVEMTDDELLSVTNLFFLSKKLRDRRSKLEAAERSKAKFLAEKEERKAATSLLFTKKTVNPFFAHTTQKMQHAQQNKLQINALSSFSSSSSDPHTKTSHGLKAQKWDHVLFPKTHVFPELIKDADHTQNKSTSPSSSSSSSNTVCCSKKHHEIVLPDDFTEIANKNFVLKNRQVQNCETLSKLSSPNRSMQVQPVNSLEVYCNAARACGLSRIEAVEYLATLLASTTTTSTTHNASISLCEKYRPRKLSQYHGKINNIPGSSFNKQSSILHFQTWLSEWKENNIQNLNSSSSWNNAKKSSKNSKHAFWYEDDEEDEEEVYSNTCLVHGPSGIGKTSSVYSCAEELGFNIIEVNAAQVRTGSAIKDLFLEATQSRHVDFSTSSSSSTLFGKGISGSTTGSAKEKKTGKASSKATSSKTNQASNKKDISNAKLTLILFEEVDQGWEMEFLTNTANDEAMSSSTVSSSDNSSSSSSSSLFRSNSQGSNSTSSTGIDNGFFAAMKTLMRSAKCAIVLTANRVPNAFEKLKCKVIPMAPPPHEQTVLQLAAICACEGIITGGLGSLQRLASLFHGDMRACINALMLAERNSSHAVSDASMIPHDFDAVHHEELSTCQDTTANTDNKPTKKREKERDDDGEGEAVFGDEEEKVTHANSAESTNSDSQGKQALLYEEVRLGRYLKPFSERWWQPITTTQGTVLSCKEDLPWSDLLALPSINHVLPAAGPLEGGTRIKIHGSGFSSRRFKLLKLLYEKQGGESEDGTEGIEMRKRRKKQSDLINDDDEDDDEAKKEQETYPINEGQGFIDNSSSSSSSFYNDQVKVYIGGQLCSDIEFVDDTRLNVTCPPGLRAGGCDVSVVVDNFLSSSTIGGSNQYYVSTYSQTKVRHRDNKFNGFFWYLKPLSSEVDENMNDESDDGDFDEFSTAKERMVTDEAILEDDEEDDDFVKPLKRSKVAKKEGSRLKKKGKSSKLKKQALTKESDSDDDDLFWEGDGNEKTKKEEFGSVDKSQEGANDAKEVSERVEEGGVDPTYGDNVVLEEHDQGKEKKENKEKDQTEVAKEELGVEDIGVSEKKKEDGEVVVEKMDEVASSTETSDLPMEEDSKQTSEVLPLVDEEIGDNIQIVEAAPYVPVEIVKSHAPKLKFTAFHNIILDTSILSPPTTVATTISLSKSSVASTEENLKRKLYESASNSSLSHHDDDQGASDVSAWSVQKLKNWIEQSRQQCDWLNHIASTLDDVSCFDTINASHLHLDGNDFKLSSSCDHAKQTYNMDINSEYGDYPFECHPNASMHHISNSIISNGCASSDYPNKINDFVGMLNASEGGSLNQKRNDDMIWFPPNTSLASLSHDGLSTMKLILDSNRHITNKEKEDFIDVDAPNEQENGNDGNKQKGRRKREEESPIKNDCFISVRGKYGIKFWDEYDNTFIRRQSHKTKILAIFNKLQGRNALGSLIHCKSKQYSYDFNKVQDYTSGALSFTTCTASSRKLTSLCNNDEGFIEVNTIDQKFLLDYLPYLQLICKYEKLKKVHSNRRKRGSIKESYLEKKGASLEDIEVIESTYENSYC